MAIRCLLKFLEKRAKRVLILSFFSALEYLKNGIYAEKDAFLWKFA